MLTAKVERMKHKENTGSCTKCGKRPARFKRPDGSWVRDKDHDLCRQCYKGELERAYAQMCAEGV